MEALTACSWLFFYKVVITNSSWILWILSSVTLALTHFFSVFVLGCQCLFLLVKKGQRKPVWIVVVALAPFLALALMWSMGPHSVQSLSWQLLRFQMVPRIEDLLLSALSIFGSWLSFAGFGVGLLGLVWHYKKATEPGQRLPLFFCIHLLIVFTSMVFLELLLERSLFLNRYFIFATPLFAVASASLIDFHWRVGSRWVAFAIFCLILSGSLGKLGEVYAPSRPPWREVALEIGKSKDPVVFTTRTLSLRSPYFSSQNISVLSWPSLDMVKIKRTLEKGQTVWFVENYWGQVTYWDELKAAVQTEGLALEQNVFNLIEKDPIYVLKIFDSE
jgi:hypothetical protein